MALRWTTIDLPWGGGIDDKRHPYLNELPKVESLTNLRFQRTGALTARDGVTSLGGPGQGPDAVWTWNGTIVQTANATALLDQPSGNWRTLGYTGPRAVEVAQRPILRTQEGASSVASAVVNGHMLTAWSTIPDGEVYVTVRNLETGVTVYGPTTVAGLDVAAPYQMSLRACAHENSYVSVFASAGLAAVNSVTFSISANGSVSVGAASIHAGTDSTHYEIHSVVNNAQLYLASDNGADLRLHRLTRSGLVLAIESTATLTGATSLNSPIGVGLAGAYAFVTSTSTGAGGGDVLGWATASGASLPAAIALVWTSTPAASVPNIQRVMRIAPRAAGGAMLLLEGVSTLSPYDLLDTPAGNIPTTAAPTGVWAIEIATAGTLTAAGTAAAWHAYMGTAPIEWEDAVHAVLVSATVEQSESAQDPDTWVSDPYGAPSYTWSRAWASRRVAYVARYSTDASKPRRVAEFGHDVASFASPISPLVRSSLASVPTPYENGTTIVFPVATVELGEEIGVTTGVFANPDLRSLREYRLSYGKTVAVSEAGGVSILASGYLAELDGDRVAELTMAPPVFVDVWVDRTTASAPQTVIAGSLCEWVACWEWRDAYGRIHRSAASKPIVGTAVGTEIAGVSARLAIPPFIDAEIKSGCLPKDVRVVFYASPQERSASVIFTTDDTYWAQTPTYGSVLEDLRDPTYPWMTLRFGRHNADRSVNLSDARLSVLSPATTRDLYTNGGVLENDPPASPLHMATTRERVWIIDSENRDRVYYSKPINSSEIAPEFNASLYLEVPTEAGALVALGAIDDLVVLFSESSIHILDTADAGPDSTGAGTWSPLRRVSREVGCVNSATVAAADVGLFFAASSGVYLLAPTGQLTWVGRDLGELVDWTTVVSTTVNPDRKEVVFALPTGTYVFDYDHAQWTVTNYTGADGPTAGAAEISEAVSYQGETVLVDTTGIAWQEDDASQEGVTYISRTGWIHLAGLQGFQRIRRFGLLGRIAFDPVPSPPFESPPDMGTLSIRAIFDYDETQFEDYTLALGTVYARLDPMRLRFHMSRQKCQAVALRFAYAPPSGGQGQNFYGRPELVGLALEVGTKGRLYPRAHSLGYTP